MYKKGHYNLGTKTNQRFLSSRMYKNGYGWTDRQKDRQNKCYKTTVQSFQNRRIKIPIIIHIFHLEHELNVKFGYRSGQKKCESKLFDTLMIF